MSLTFSNLSADSFESQLRAGRKRPRVREAVSCSHCRARKIRCDRELPCNPCSERGIPLQCNYMSDRDRLPYFGDKDQSPTPKPRVHKSIRKVIRPEDRIRCHPQQSKDAATVPEKVCSREKEFKEVGKVALVVRQAPSQVTNNPFLSPSRSHLMGVSHWMSPCYEMAVTQAILDRAPEFEPSRKAFSELKTLIRIQNKLPPATSSADAGFSKLWHFFPDRQTCLRWAAQYFRTYNRIYSVVDPLQVSRDIELIYSGQLDDMVCVSKVMLVISLAMQHIESERLNGRWLAKQVEGWIQSSPRFQQPCINVMQVFLLILVMDTISASETDKLYDLVAVHDQTIQVANSMRLDRNPSFLANVKPYEAELRKRLWHCFVRLNLEYCIRSGSAFSLRLEESDCPLPTNTDLQTLEPKAETNGLPNLGPDEQSKADMEFSISAAKLAKIVAPVYKILHSANPPKTPEQLHADLRNEFERLLVSLPRGLRPGFQSTSPVEELQQSMVSTHINSFLSIIALGSLFNTSPSPSQRGILMEAWDHETFILNQFRSLFQRTEEVGTMARQFLWADASRAALSACWIVGRLRKLDIGRIIIPHPQQIVCVMESKLAEFSSFSSQFWQSCFHLGPVIAKTHLILSVTLSVTTSLYSNRLTSYEPVNLRRRMLSMGVSAAEKVTAQMKTSLQQRIQGLLQRQQQLQLQTTNLAGTGQSMGPQSAATQFSPITISPDDSPGSMLSNLNLWEWPPSNIHTSNTNTYAAIEGAIPAIMVPDTDPMPTSVGLPPPPQQQSVAAPPPLITDSLCTLDFSGSNSTMSDPSSVTSLVSPYTLFNTDPAALAQAVERAVSGDSTLGPVPVFDALIPQSLWD
ncbi:hypothetical protein V8F06_008191 [Rhypophila decipiens]